MIYCALPLGMLSVIYQCLPSIIVGMPMISHRLISYEQLQGVDSFVAVAQVILDDFRMSSAKHAISLPGGA